MASKVRTKLVANVSWVSDLTQYHKTQRRKNENSHRSRRLSTNSRLNPSKKNNIKFELRRSSLTVQPQIEWLYQRCPTLRKPFSSTEDDLSIGITQTRNDLYLTCLEMGIVLGLSKVQIFRIINDGIVSPSLQELLIILNRAPRFVAGLLLDYAESGGPSQEERERIARIREKLRWRSISG